jgi:hypothetical protein
MVFTSGQIQHHGGKAANLVKYAASHRSMESCGLLMEEGCLLTNEVLEAYFDNLYYSGDHYSANNRQRVEMGRLLLAHASHLLIDDLEPFLRYPKQLVARSPEALEALLPHIYPPFRDRPQSERARYAMVASPENFCLLLGTINSASILAVEQAVLANTSSGHDAFESWWDFSLSASSTLFHQPKSLLGVFAASYGIYYPQNVTTAWVKVLAQIIASGNCNAKRDSLIIPLVQSCHIGGDNLDNSSRQLNQKLASWIELLRIVGTDLSLLADNERRIFSQHPIEIRCYSRRVPSLWSVRVVGISTGPDSADWKIHLANPLDEWAADFCNLVHEGPEQVVPGSWVDEKLEAELGLRSKPGKFKTLWTSRRKRKRYLRQIGLSAAAARKILGEEWIHYPEVNKHFRGRAIMERDGTQSEFLVYNYGPQLYSKPEVHAFDLHILQWDSEDNFMRDTTLAEYCSSCYMKSPGTQRNA